MNLKMLSLLVMGLLVPAAVGCVHPRVKYHKAKLLDPMMDPAKTEGFHASFRAEPMTWNERGTADVGGSLGGSCPTCGG
jgi:hypothetical protein